MIRFDTKKDMEHYDNLYHQIYEKDKEIDRLNNIIGELEKWLKEENYKNEDFWCINSVEVLDKLKALKEGKE